MRYGVNNGPSWAEQASSAAPKDRGAVRKDKCKHGVLGEAVDYVMSEHGMTEEEALQQLDAMQLALGPCNTLGAPTVSVSHVAEVLALVWNLRIQVHGVLGVELERRLGRGVPMESSPSLGSQGAGAHGPTGPSARGEECHRAPGCAAGGCTQALPAVPYRGLVRQAAAQHGG